MASAVTTDGATRGAGGLSSEVGRLRTVAWRVSGSGGIMDHPDFGRTFSFQKLSDSDSQWINSGRLSREVRTQT